jgi:hypothetical protein
MKKLMLTVIAIIFSCTLFSQRNSYRSNVYDGITFLPIEGVNIYNITSEKFTFSDKKGYFVIDVKENDTLIFSKSIYRQMMVVMTSEQLAKRVGDYFLYYKAIMLKEVSVLGLNPSYEGFKRDIAAIKINENFANVNLLPDEKKMIAEAAKGPNILRGAAASPITYLYNKFSRKAKMDRLYREMLTYEDELDKLPQKYNRKIVSEITGIKDEDELIEFMIFCRFGYYDIIRWTAQEIIGAIRYKYNEYQYYKAVEENENKIKNE